MRAPLADPSPEGTGADSFERLRRPSYLPGSSAAVPILRRCEAGSAAFRRISISFPLKQKQCVSHE